MELKSDSLTTFWLLCYCRSNRTPLKEGFYAIGALKNDLLDDVFKDDLLAVLGLESLCAVQYFTRLQAAIQYSIPRCTKECQREIPLL